MKAFGIALICKNIQEEVSFNAKALVAWFLFSLLELTLVWKKKLFLYHWIPTPLHLMCSTKTFFKKWLCIGIYYPEMDIAKN